ncbi:MAG: hypothetical protein AB7O44_30470 [Hyphomicrobiaceae bacterium]
MPRWHGEDDGAYIGTECVVIARDPDTGWVNLGRQARADKSPGCSGAPLTAGAALIMMAVPLLVLAAGLVLLHALTP